MSPEVVSLLITALAVLLIVLQVVWGAIRGLKKSVFRLVWIAVWGVVCLFVSGAVAKAIVNLDISFLGLSANGSAVSTLPEFIQKTIEASNPDIASLIADNPKIVELCTTLACCILSLVCFEILFWLTKWLLWPVWAILSHAFFGKKKNKQPKQEQGDAINQQVLKSAEKPQKKHAGFGALVGVGLGLLVCMFTFVPISSISSAILQIDAETATMQEDGTSVGMISQSLGNQSQFLTVYEDSIISKAFTYTGIGFVQQKMGDLLTSAKVDGENISLTSEISNMALVYSDYATLSSLDFSNASRQTLAQALNSLKDINSRLLSSGIVNGLYDSVVPYIAQKMLTQDDYFLQLPKLDDENLNVILQNSIKALFGIGDDGQIDAQKVLSCKDLQSDISTLLSAVEKLNQNNLLAEIVTSKLTLQTAKDEVSTQLLKDVSSALFSLKTMQKLVPAVFEPAIKFAVESLPQIDDAGAQVKVQFTAFDGTVELQSVKNLVDNTIDNMVPTLKNLDENSKIYISASNFANLGAIVDDVRDGHVLSTQTFQSLIDYLSALAKINLKDITNDQNLNNIIINVVEDLPLVESFESELACVGNAYNAIDVAGDNFGAKNLFEALEYISNAKLYKLNEDSIISNLAQFVTDYVTSNNLPIEADNLNLVVESLKDVDDFNAEYLKIKDFCDFVEPLAKQGTLQDELLNNLTVLGKHLDTAVANGSVILSDANDKILLKNVIQKMELPEDFETYKNQLKTNVDSIANYESELTAVDEALKIANITETGREKLVAVGEVLDKIKDSCLFSNIISQVVAKYIDDGISSANLDAEIASIVSNIKSNLNNQVIYADEFGVLYDFVNSNFDSLQNFKAFLSANLINADGSGKSKLLTVSILYDIANVMIGKVDLQKIDLKTELQQQVQKDKTDEVNILDVLNQLDTFKNDFEALCTVPSTSSITAQYLSNLGATVDGLSSTYNYVLNASAQSKIGMLLAKEINDKVQSDEYLSAQVKADVQQTLKSADNFDTFAQLYSQFASDLQLA